MSAKAQLRALTCIHIVLFFCADLLSYFVIHPPRQTGKTTAMLALAQQLTNRGRYTAVMVSAEVGDPYHADERHL